MKADGLRVGVLTHRQRWTIAGAVVASVALLHGCASAGQTESSAASMADGQTVIDYALAPMGRPVLVATPIGPDSDFASSAAFVDGERLPSDGWALAASWIDDDEVLVAESPPDDPGAPGLLVHYQPGQRGRAIALSRPLTLVDVAAAHDGTWALIAAAPPRPGQLLASLWRIDLDTGRTAPVELTGDIGEYTARPVFIDEHTVVVATSNGSSLSSVGADYWLAKVDLETGRAVRLTAPDRRAENPCRVPGTTFVTYESTAWPEGRRVVGAIDVMGGGDGGATPKEVLVSPMARKRPCVGPSGATLFYLSSSDPGEGVVIDHQELEDTPW